MLRAVIDTNVFISAIPENSYTRQIFEALIDDKFELIISEAIIKEILRVALYPKLKSPPYLMEELFIKIRQKCVALPGLYSVDKIKADPTDDKFLACAIEGNADFIVSRDPHLLNIKHYQNIQIITPEKFLELLHTS